MQWKTKSASIFARVFGFFAQRRQTGVASKSLVDSLPKLYFFHIPKTAGTSLRAFLDDQYSDAARCPAESWADLGRLTEAEMRTYSLVRGHFSVNLGDWLPGFQAITFLRDPVERTISAIRHMMRDPAYGALHERTRGRALVDVIYDEIVIAGLADAQTKLLSCDVPVSEILKFVQHRVAAGLSPDLGELEWGSSVDKAVSNLSRFSYVGTTDQFGLEMEALCLRLGFLPPITVPKLNRAGDLGHDILQPKHVEHIESFLSLDLELLRRVRLRKKVATSPQNILEYMWKNGSLSAISLPFSLSLERPFHGAGWSPPINAISGEILRYAGSRASIWLPTRPGNRSRYRVLVEKSAHIQEVAIFVDGKRVDTQIVNDELGRSEIMFYLTAKKMAPPLTAVVVESRELGQAFGDEYPSRSEPAIALHSIFCE